MSQGATLVAFGCGDRHPLPVVLAPCSAGSSSALYDDLGDAFNDGSNAGRKVSNSSAIISHPKSETSILRPVAINIYARYNDNVFAEHTAAPNQPPRCKIVGRNRWPRHEQNEQVSCRHRHSGGSINISQQTLQKLVCELDAGSLHLHPLVATHQPQRQSLHTRRHQPPLIGSVHRPAQAAGQRMRITHHEL